MQGTLAVRARGMSKYYGNTVALDGVDLDIDLGQVHGFVGVNGAGKTTLLGHLLGLCAPDSGTLEILGRPVRRAFAVPEGVAGFVDQPGLYPSLTARQNLTAISVLSGLHRSDERVAPVLDEVGLADVADVRVHGFSLGMRQRLGLAAALLVRPRLLILDEPTNGLDPAGRQQVHRLIEQLAGDGAAVVVSSHQMADLATLCSEVTILVTGRVAFTGSLDKLAAECPDVDHRLRTSDPVRARGIADGLPGLRTRPLSRNDDVVVNGTTAAVQQLVASLVAHGIAVREMTPVMSPLEAAFHQYTGVDLAETTA